MSGAKVLPKCTFRTDVLNAGCMCRQSNATEHCMSSNPTNRAQRFEFHFGYTIWNRATNSVVCEFNSTRKVWVGHNVSPYCQQVIGFCDPQNDNQQCCLADNCLACDSSATGMCTQCPVGFKYNSTEPLRSCVLGTTLPTTGKPTPAPATDPTTSTTTTPKPPQSTTLTHVPDSTPTTVITTQSPPTPQRTTVMEPSATSVIIITRTPKPSPSSRPTPVPPTPTDRTDSESSSRFTSTTTTTPTTTTTSASIATTGANTITMTTATTVAMLTSRGLADVTSVPMAPDSTVPIVVGVVFGFIGLLLLIAIVLAVLRARKRRHDSETAAEDRGRQAHETEMVSARDEHFSNTSNYAKVSVTRIANEYDAIDSPLE